MAATQPLYRPLCNCCLLPGSHFLDRCTRINRQKAAEERRRAWQERHERIAKGEKELKGLKEEHKKELKAAKEEDLEVASTVAPDDASSVTSCAPREPARGVYKPQLYFTLAESERLRKVKAALQEIYDIQRQIDAGKKMELELWQWQKVDGKHAKQRLKNLEECDVITMESAGYKVPPMPPCRDFRTSAGCRWGSKCKFKH